MWYFLISRQVLNKWLKITCSEIFSVKSPFLSQKWSDKVDKLAKQATIAKLKKSHAAFNQRENAGNFVCVYSGALKVQKSKKGGNLYRVGRLYSGNYFSKHAVINNLKRLGRIAALTNAIILKIHRQSFYESAFPIYFRERIEHWCGPRTHSLIISIRTMNRLDFSLM